MLVLLWRISTVIHDYLQTYMPTNRAITWLRTPRGLKWAIPVGLVATPTYLFAMSLCAMIVQDGGPGYLNLLVLLFYWNATKFACMAVLSLPLIVLRALGLRRDQTRQMSREGLAQSVRVCR